MPAPSIRAVARREALRAINSLESYCGHIDNVDRLSRGKGYDKLEAAIDAIQILTVELHNITKSLADQF